MQLIERLNEERLEEITELGRLFQTSSSSSSSSFISPKWDNSKRRVTVVAGQQGSNYTVH